MNKDREQKQLKVSESEYNRNLGAAASAGAVIGGAAFAAAAYSTGVWETEDNEVSESVEESSTNEIVHPETISIEISNPVAADIAYTTESIHPTETEEINIISTENDEIVIENIEYPDEGEILQSDAQEVMDFIAGETIDIPLLEDAIYSDDTSIEDSQQFFI